MTPADSARVIDRLTGGFDKRLADDTLNIWQEELAELDFSPAYAAARGIVREAKYFPHFSEFLTAYAKHQGRQLRPVGDIGKACPHCDHGWQTTGPNEVVACAYCAPVVFEKQLAGAYMPTSHNYSRVDNHGDITDPQPNVRALLDELKATLPARTGSPTRRAAATPTEPEED